MILSVDPGSSRCAWALWEQRTLIACGRTPRPPHGITALAAAQFIDDALPHAGDLAIEVMAWRPGDVRSQPNDLLAVQFVVGFLLGRYGRGMGLLASTWKGSIPKSIHHPRIWKALAPEERNHVLAGWRALTETEIYASLEPNTLDAIGIGLYYIGRKA